MKSEQTGLFSLPSLSLIDDIYPASNSTIATDLSPLFKLLMAKTQPRGIDMVLKWLEEAKLDTYFKRTRMDIKRLKIPHTKFNK